VVFISEGLRRELHPQANIRVSVISPGKVATELTDRITDQDIRKAFEQSEEQPLEAEAIARAVRYAVEQPEDVDVNEIIIRPTSQQL
jgi:NADP-dependent 3-hydroxy acid dehydrogenase YdfG